MKSKPGRGQPTLTKPDFYMRIQEGPVSRQFSPHRFNSVQERKSDRLAYLDYFLDAGNLSEHERYVRLKLTY